MTRNGFIAICSVALFIGGACHAHGLDPSKRLTQYRHSRWRAQDGFLPSNPSWVSQAANRIVSHINLGAPPGHMVEEQDGSLWVTTWRRPGSPGPHCHASDREVRCFGKADGLPIQITLPILSDGTGGFWIGNDTSLVHWKAGEGTEVQLIPPSAVSYEKPRNGAGFRLFRKLRVHEHRS